MINTDFMIYGAMLIDEWTPPNTFNNDNHNWFGLQFGIKKNKLFLPNDLLHIEYTWTDHRIYRHKFNVNDYYSYGYPVGFWAGPHAEELYVDYTFGFGNSKFKLMYSDAKRGELTQGMLDEQYCWPDDCPLGIIGIYDRFDGVVESKRIIKLSLIREITLKINASMSISHVNWKNSGSKYIVDSSSMLTSHTGDVIKNSINFKVLYSF